MTRIRRTLNEITDGVTLAQKKERLGILPPVKVGKVQCPGCTKKLDVVEFTGDEDDENYVCSKCGKRWLILQTNYTPGLVPDQFKRTYMARGSI